VNLLSNIINLESFDLVGTDLLTIIAPPS